jgi:hypothetical protein
MIIVVKEIIEATLEQDKDGTWWYVHIAKESRDKYKHLEKRGIVPITATIGSTTWDGSILPWADGSGQISVNKNVRLKEGLHLGDSFKIQISPR